MAKVKVQSLKFSLKRENQKNYSMTKDKYEKSIFKKFSVIGLINKAKMLKFERHASDKF